MGQRLATAGQRPVGPGNVWWDSKGDTFQHRRHSVAHIAQIQMNLSPLLCLLFTVSSGFRNGH